MAFSPAFLELHANLPRQGVGADWCTREALRRLPPLRKPPAVIDLGCGPGRQTVVLADHFRSRIDAVDICPTFLEQLMENATAAGVADLIHPRRENFTRLPDASASFDLVWSEGSARIIGLANALTGWGRLLRPRGVLAISDCIWFADPPPAEARDFWDRAYPGMTDLEGVRKIAREAGMTVLDHFSLPRSAWWDEYYAPLTRRIREVEERLPEDPALRDLVEATREEIAVHQRFGDSYGYAFFLLRQV